MLQPALTFFSRNNQQGVWAKASGNYRGTVGKLLWGNPAAWEKTRREDASPGTLILSLPSWPVSSLSCMLFLSVCLFLLLYPYIFSQKQLSSSESMSAISYWRTLIICLHACDLVSTRFVFSKDFPFYNLLFLILFLSTFEKNQAVCFL